jgi:ribonuclease HI
MWDEELVKDIFWEADARLILVLTVHEGQNNSLAWHYDRKGNFTVRSAYKLFRYHEINSRRKQVGSSSNADTSDKEKLWKQIWKLPIPGKLRHYLWRFAHNSHALKINLKMRGMDIPTKCVLCNRVDEDGGHLYFKCKEVKLLWRCLGLEDQRVQLSVKNTAIEVIQHILSCSEDKSLLMIIALWSWWKERNKGREGEGRRQAEALAHGIQVYAAEVQKIFKKERVGTARSVRKWEKPPNGTLKLNCDATFDTASKTGGWGFIIRDEDGDVVLAGSGRVDHLLDSFQAEVARCLQGIQSAIDLGISRIVVELDALLVVQAISSTAYDRSAAGNLIKELRGLVQSNFSSFKCVYVPRSCNAVADALAIHGCNQVMGAATVLSSLPSCIQTLVAKDLAPV